MTGIRWIVVAAAALAAPAVASAGDGVRVTASALNVRSGPSTGYARVGLVHSGEVYPVVARSGSWVKIQLSSRTGWSHGSYLSNTNADIRTVTASALNVRSGPSTGYRVLGQLRSGTLVAVSNTSGSWARIAFDGRTAWVHGGYLRGGGGGTTPPAPPPTTSRPRSRAGFIQLPSAGPGFYGYYAASKRWGTPTMVYGIERIARRWTTEARGAPRIGVGDLSLTNGGPISGHASHQRGVDADLRPVRNDGREAPVTIHQSAYSRSLTRKLLLMFEAELSVTHIFFNDSGIYTPHRQYWRNHDNHFHVRISR